MTLRILKILATTVALVAIAIGAAMLSMRFAVHGSDVQVPSLTGETTGDAARSAEDAGLTSTVEDRAFSNDVPAGHVVRQVPEAGTIVRKNWTVRLTESLGAETVTIPRLIGLDERLAVLTIRQADMEVGTIGTMSQPGATPGTVVAQDPAPGPAITARPRVSIILAQDTKPADTGYVMPSLVGQSYTDAAATVRGAGLKVAAPATAGDDASAADGVPLASGSTAGTVIAQRPAAGSHVASGATVHLTVAP